MTVLANNPLVPTAWEAALSVIGLAYLVFMLVFLVFLINVLLTWHRKNKLRIIELEFEERAIDNRKAARRMAGPEV
ncbi:MAG: hypothetical protein Q4A03_10785 [Rothia sp. (in: high G+C Gram-positive bacteria)]|uniref:hypothetical protein n=1 Tax=Rothia sp. (in: high G+C Gram-positive bacteria) TaxID=1885016 RepID=UPI00270EBBC3|nr:hypothetical protein [Rothia sp. (in: high G+C Gram-positive bacteria)]